MHQQNNKRTNHQSGRSRVRHQMDFSPQRRPSASYTRRSSGIIPSNDTEYMIALGSSASRRNEQLYTQKDKFFSNIAKKFKNTHWSIPNARNYKRLIPTVGLLAVLTIGVFGFLLRNHESSVIADPDLRHIMENNGDTPDDTAPYNQNNYAVSPDMPRQLTIQKLGINSRVVRLSARQNSEPKSPQNIYDVGWYENSAKPGETGAALLIGHIRGVEKNGVFYDLTRLVPGDEFQLELGDGTLQNYQIVKMEAYERGQVDFSALSDTAIGGHPGLNLLTAVASYGSNSQVVQQLAVFAVEKNIDQFHDNSAY